MATNCPYPIWNCLPEHEQRALAAYYGRHFHKKYRPPGSTPLEIESSAETARIMREAPRRYHEVSR